MDANFNKMQRVEYYLANAYSEIQYRTDTVLNSSMSYTLSKVDSGYQIAIAPDHLNLAQLDSSKVHEIKILLSEDEFEQLVVKSQKVQHESNERLEKFIMLEESHRSILAEIFNKRLSFLTTFQHGYLPSEEKNKKRFIELLTTYPIAPEISQVVGKHSFYDKCNVSFEDKGESYRVKAIDQHHSDSIIVDFEINKKQFCALAKLEYLGLGHQPWTIERNLFAPQMREGSLYLKMKDTSAVQKTIAQINAVYGSDASRTSGAGANYLKINCKTDNGKKAISDILTALNMKEVPSYKNDSPSMRYGQ